MANTLKFGNGEWYGKKDTILAYNDENSNYKPLPFDFSRASKATVINKDGLIETVGSGEPRIDYKDDSKGALLLEPQRSNRVTYSEDLTQWTDYNASAVLSNETIYGKNAYKIVEDSTVNYHGIYLSNLFTADGTNYIWSVYVKGGERRYVVLTARTGISSNDSAVIFDTQDGVWTLDVSSQNQAFSAESVGNGWWRIAIEGNPTSGAYDSYTIAASLGGTTYTDANYQGDGTSGIYVAMPQTEQGSYATSYIPTQGSTVTRLADVCNNGGNEQVINSTEGVLYVEMNAFDNTSRISLSDGSTSNRVSFRITDDNIDFQYRVGGSYSYRVDVDVDNSNTNKMAMSFNNGVFVGYLNGAAIGSPISGTSLSQGVLDRLNFNDGNSSDSFEGNVKDVRVYNTALTNQELINLTTI